MKRQTKASPIQRWLITILLLVLLAIGAGYIYMADQLSIETLG